MSDQVIEIEERWLPVVGWEGYYSVSSLGRIRREAGGYSNAIPGRIVKGYGTHDGYQQVTLCRDGVERKRYVHRIVLAAFVGPCPPGMEGCHGPDPSKLNNAVSNLRWDTHKKNGEDSVAHGTTARGEKQGQSKLTTAQVLEIRALADAGTISQAKIGKMFNVSQTSVYLIRIRRNWRHIEPKIAPSSAG